MSSTANLSLPAAFRTRIDTVSDDGLSVRLFAGLYNPSDCDAWMVEYSINSSTRWTFNKTKHTPIPIGIVCSQIYQCRSSNCKAIISIYVKVNNKHSRWRHQHINDNLPAVIKLNLHHSHASTSVDPRYALASMSVRMKFESLFLKNLGVTRAIHKYKEERKEAGLLNENSHTNRLNCPKRSSVEHWYNSWLKNNMGSPFSKESIEKLQEEQTPEYNNSGIYLKMWKELFAVVIVTPLMKRATNLVSSDVHHSIAFVLTKVYCWWFIRFIPLAVLITKGQSTVEYTSEFTLLNETLGCKISPRFITTDDFDAESIALESVFFFLILGFCCALSTDHNQCGGDSVI